MAEKQQVPTAEPVLIRRLVPADLVAYKALRDTLLAAHPQAFSSDATEGLSRPPESYQSRLGLDRPEGGEFTIGAWSGSSLVGAISCERDRRLKVRHIGHVIGMMVRDEMQGRGVGRALLEACLIAARAAKDLRILTLTVTAGNVAAIRLYEGAGFARYGHLPNAILVDSTFHAKDLMVLTL